MGVAFGKINFDHGITPFSLFKDFCKANKIELTIDDEENLAIQTPNLDSLKIMNSSGRRIEGQGGSYIEGMDNEYEVTILGIPYPFYGEEFPEHVLRYQNQFGTKDQH
jgi:hypothetical protein